MTQNGHIYVSCRQPEVAGVVISGRTVKTVQGYVVVNSKVAISSSFCDISKTIIHVSGMTALSENAYMFHLIIT